MSSIRISNHQQLGRPFSQDLIRLLNKSTNTRRWCKGECHLYGQPSTLSFVLSRPRTSTSNSSMTSKASFKLSINPLTATLSIRFVVALYSVLRTVSSVDFELDAGIVENVRDTRGESSLSTRRAWRAADARRAVGRRMSIASEQGNSGSSWIAIAVIRDIILCSLIFDGRQFCTCSHALQGYQRR